MLKYFTHAADRLLNIQAAPPHAAVELRSGKGTEEKEEDQGVAEAKDGGDDEEAMQPVVGKGKSKAVAVRSREADIDDDIEETVPKRRSTRAKGKKILPLGKAPKRVKEVDTLSANAVTDLTKLLEDRKVT